MGSLKQAHTSTCTSSSYPPLSTLLQFTRRRSSPPSLSPTSTEWLMTTARLTSRRQSHPMAESRPPLTPLITTTDSSLKSPTREPPSTPQSPRRDTATLPPLMPQPPLTSPLLNYFLD